MPMQDLQVNSHPCCLMITRSYVSKLTASSYIYGTAEFCSSDFVFTQYHIKKLILASGCGESRRCGQQIVGISGLIGRPHVGTLPEKPAG